MQTMQTSSNALLNTLLDHYAESHRNPRNELIHCICVPAIVFAVLGMILSANIGLALIAVGLSLLYYIRLGWRAAFEMAVILIAMLFAWLMLMPAHHMLASAILIFALAWVGQFVGHAIEGAKPSFLEDLQYLLVGPLFVLAVIKRKWPVATR